MNNANHDPMQKYPGSQIPADVKTIEQPQTVTHSIRRRLLALAMGMTILAIVIVTTVAIASANTVSQRALQTSSQILRSQAEDYLVQINQTIASQNDLILDRSARDVQAVAGAARTIFSAKLPENNWPPEEHMFTGPEGQYMNSGEDESSVFVPYFKEIDQKVLRDIELSAYLDLVMAPVMENNPNAAAIYMGTPNEVTRYYPNIQLGEVLPADFEVTQRVWYATSVSEGNFQKETKPVWSPVYLDATGLGTVTTVAVAVYNQYGVLSGVIGLDVTLDEINTNIEMARFLQTGYSFMIDQDGKTISFPEQAYLDFLGRLPEEEEFATELFSNGNQNINPQFTQIVERMVLGESGFASIQEDGKELFIAFSPLESTGWSLASVVTSDDVLQSVSVLGQDLNQATQTLLTTRILPILALISIALIFLALIWTNRLVTPIQTLAEAARRIGSGQWDTNIPIQSQDELGLLARTISKMAAQLRQSFGVLEQRVAERTHQLEQRSLQLQTAAEVARDITTAENLDSMLKNTTGLISNRFGFYNVSIFLIDDSGEYAYLKSASGKLGAQLLQQNIRLRVGQQGIVGYVTRYGQARIAEDVSSDRFYMAVPLLPETRSEIALPLRLGERIIGALDIQSDRQSAFDQDILTILQTLADQIAIAIENMRLVTQLQTTLQEARLLFQDQIRESWLQTASRSKPMAYEYNRTEIVPLQSMPNSAHFEESNGHVLKVPVKLREQVIGYIGLEKDDPSLEWTEDEITVVEATASQVALTLENARLVEETQNRVVREQLTSQVTTNMRVSLDVEDVLKTAIEEIYKALDLENIVIQLEPEDIDEDQTAYLSRSDKNAGEIDEGELEIFKKQQTDGGSP